MGAVFCALTEDSGSVAVAGTSTISPESSFTLTLCFSGSIATMLPDPRSASPPITTRDPCFENLPVLSRTCFAAFSDLSSGV